MNQNLIVIFFIFPGVVHEHPRIGSDGESEEGSRTSEDVVSPSHRTSASAGAVANGPGITMSNFSPFSLMTFPWEIRSGYESRIKRAESASFGNPDF